MFHLLFLITNGGRLKHMITGTQATRSKAKPAPGKESDVK